MGVLLKIIASLNGLLKVLCLCIQIDSWWLTLIDSTHKTNRYDWRLFTLYVRDIRTYGCWNVDAHFFVSSEDADTVTEALVIIRNKCCRWSPRYILSDQNNIEAKSIKKTFPGIIAGEQECQILLCIVPITVA